MDEEGNQGYYLYNESTGEEKLFSIVEEERKFARGTGSAVYYAEQMIKKGGQKASNKASNKKMIKKLGDEAKEILGVSKYLKRIPGTKSDMSVRYGKSRIEAALEHRSNYPEILTAIDKKIPGNVKKNMDLIYNAATPRSVDELKKSAKNQIYKIR